MLIRLARCKLERSRFSRGIRTHRLFPFHVERIQRDRRWIIHWGALVARSSGQLDVHAIKCPRIPRRARQTIAPFSFSESAAGADSQSVATGQLLPWVQWRRGRRV